MDEAELNKLSEQFEGIHDTYDSLREDKEATQAWRKEIVRLLGNQTDIRYQDSLKNTDKLLQKVSKYGMWAVYGANSSINMYSSIQDGQAPEEQK